VNVTSDKTVKELGIVPELLKSLLNSYTNMMKTTMELSILKMLSILTITESYSNPVIITLMELLILVNSIPVSSILKTNGEPISVEPWVTSIVTVHSSSLLVMMLGIVKMSMLSLPLLSTLLM